MLIRALALFLLVLSAGAHLAMLLGTVGRKAGLEGDLSRTLEEMNAFLNEGLKPGK